MPGLFPSYVFTHCSVPKGFSAVSVFLSVLGQHRCVCVCVCVCVYICVCVCARVKTWPYLNMTLPHVLGQHGCVCVCFCREGTHLLEWKAALPQNPPSPRAL